jgi:hypothetical protein
MEPNEELLDAQNESEEILPEEADKVAGGGGGYSPTGVYDGS